VQSIKKGIVTDITVGALEGILGIGIGIDRRLHNPQSCVPSLLSSRTSWTSPSFERV
jgi:hypothetical protein